MASFPLLRIALFWSFGFLLISLRAEAPRQLFFTWQGDTGTTLTVTFQTFTADPIPAVVYWDTVAREGMVEDYRQQTSGEAFRIEGLNDRWIYRVELTGLTPGGTLFLVAGDPRSGISREYKVRTLPHDARPLRVVTGGDLGFSYLARKLLREAARTSPDVALVGGDLAYADGDIAKVDRWDALLTYYTEEMVTPEGFAIPLIASIGNHEVIGGYLGDKSKAPFFFGLLGQDPEKTYFMRRLGANLAVVVLDSGHIAPHDGEQAAWLDRTLAELADVPFRAAIYHVPLYPSHRAFDGQGSVAGRKHWGPLFDRHRLTVAFENHDHMHKRTPLLKANAVSRDGTLYIGDGCWGVRPRTLDEAGRWYLETASAVAHFWVVDVEPSGLVYRAVDARGRVFDTYPADIPGAVEAARIYRSLPPAYTLPGGWTKIAPWTPAGPNRGSTTLTFTNGGQHPVQLSVVSNRAPRGARLVAPADTPSVKPGATVTLPLSFTAERPLDREGLGYFRVEVTARAETADPTSAAIWQGNVVVPAAR
jgi:acid phosphatase type 7